MLTVFGDFLVDGQDLALRLIYHLYIGGHFFCTGTDGYMLAFLYNIHELVVAVTLDCGFKGAYFTAQTAAFDIGDDLIPRSLPVRCRFLPWAVPELQCLHSLFFPPYLLLYLLTGSFQSRIVSSERAFNASQFSAAHLS